MRLKPGYQTTEFWAMCGTQITAFLVALSGADTSAKIMSGATAFAAILAYIYSRHQTKIAMPSPTAAGDSSPAGGKAGSSLAPIVALALLFAFTGSALAQPRHTSPPRLRINIGLGLGWAPPAYVAPLPPPFIVPPTVRIMVDPARPPYPGLPIYFQPGPPPLYYQLLPAAP